MKNVKKGLQNILFAYRKLKNNTKTLLKNNTNKIFSNTEILKKVEKNLEKKANTVTIQEYVNGKGNANSEVTIGGKPMHSIKNEKKKVEKIKIYKFIAKELGNLKEIKKIKGKR